MAQIISGFWLQRGLLLVHAIENLDEVKGLYFSARRIRFVEESIAKKYSEKKMRCPTHLSTGQELAGAAIGVVTNSDDLAVSTHRAHAHYLGKGGDLDSLIAELHGKETGCSRGRGGSMHLVDRSIGFEGSTAIVGNSIPVAVGLAKGIKLSKENKICVVFVGDAVFETGVFYESVNIAATWGVPILFICENNFYSVYSSLDARQPKGRENHQLVNAMGIPSEFVDGMNGLGVYTALKIAAARVRETCLPYFIEMSAYRWREHCGPNYDNHIGYRTEEEFNGWRAKDYLAGLESFLLSENVLDQSAIERHENETLREIELAFNRAMSAPSPKSADFNKFEYRL